ncbi:aminotransferase class I/II-fold pyridoxal phosphate-dependent enzyme [Marinobacterium sp. AK62]|uniref:Aminotransferase class I/II-fold pyridoxal phosphate-dependent enzyme n=1 Tax=Marinobacterium alkalitolerans TaxID=1542925 RepID=A0ABS3ZDC1_9GAMM|nr:aminotransferase class I/II-fold pyridoxal phosphate-dependent enzyme [Marinobacterium alkalitolerans]MBP0049699.1 aminotransferase class I/II-fold pyridoxal phosphate-dependent enzyme [Marinobacterium alkalitolerans]
MKLETLALHAGYEVDPTTNSAAVPIYQTTSYTFDDAQHGADLFDLKVQGNIYSRIMNPTNDVLEKRVAAMEGGVAALAVASGMAAITYTIQTLAEAGDNIISTSELYGGTYNLFAHTLPRQGLEVRFAQKDDFAGIESKIDANTKAIYCESVGNPSGGIADIEKLAEIAHRHGVPLVVDNTVPSPALWRPIEQGADIVVTAATKYIGGHGTTIGGVIVDSGNFPWAENKERFPLLNEPDVSYHGVIYTEAFGPAAFIGRARVVPLRNMGAALSPMNAFMLMQGLETLSLRMERICENTQKVAEYLENHPEVTWVNYAGLSSHKDHALAQKYMDGKASGILSFGLKSGREGTRRFYDALEVFLRLVNIGDCKSLASIPAETTHRQLNDEELKSAGVSPEMVRLSIGIEHVDDLMADLDQALSKASA